MKVILLKDTPGVGRRGEVKEVSPGHARNLLFPRGFAEIATPEAINKIAKEMIAQKERREIGAELLHKNIEALHGITLQVTRKANEKGHLFAGLDKSEIKKLLYEKTRLEIPEDYFDIEKPIKETGERKIKVTAGNAVATFTLNVIGVED